MQSIINTEPNFKETMPEVSPLAVDLVAQMLSKDPDDRPSAKEVLEHPWFVDVYKVQK